MEHLCSLSMYLSLITNPDAVIFELPTFDSLLKRKKKCQMVENNSVTESKPKSGKKIKDLTVHDWRKAVAAQVVHTRNFDSSHMGVITHSSHTLLTEFYSALYYADE